MLINDITQLYEQANDLNNKNVALNGWVRSNRNNGSVGFLIINDGSTILSAQIVYKKNLENLETIKAIRSGSAVYVEGQLKVTPESSQPFEIQATKIQLLKSVTDDYPLQKKFQTDEYLRQLAHLRVRTDKYYAIMKIRSVLAQSIHVFFSKNNFIYVTSPIITSNDAEGAGECFTLNDNEQNPFWPKKPLLTVSGQFAAEAYAQAFKRVYTFGPTFRAEKSHTSRHLAEFWMVEPEISFMNLSQMMVLIEQLIKHSIVYLNTYANKELMYCNEHWDNTLLERLNKILDSSFKKITYTEAISLLQDAKNNGHEFEDENIYWGMDLSSEHERYICENVFNEPTFIFDYPKELKSFYMKLNPDNKTVAAVDLLVPGIGELCGGSQREDSSQLLRKRCEELNLSTNQLDWYIKMRDYGYYKSSGFGMGFDRLVMFLTGIDNLKDAIPFPRAHGLLDF